MNLENDPSQRTFGQSMYEFCYAESGEEEYAVAIACDNQRVESTRPCLGFWPVLGRS